MGSFGTGFLQSLGEAAHRRSLQAQQQDMAQKQMEAQYHWGALDAAMKRGGQIDADGNFHSYTQEDYQNLVHQAVTNVSKAYGNSKPVKAIWDKAKGMIGSLSGHPEWHPAVNGGGQDGQAPTTAPAQAGPAPAAAAPAAQDATPSSQDLAASISHGGIPAPPGQDISVPRGATSVTPPAAAAASVFPPPVASAAIPPPPGAAPATQAVLSPTAVLSSGDGNSAPVDEQVAPDLSAAAPPPSARTMATDTTDPTAILKSTLPPGVVAPAQGSAAPADPATAAVMPSTAAPHAPFTAQQMLNGYISPQQQATLQQNIDLQKNQRLFQQQQAQLQQRIEAFEKNTGRKATSTEIALMSGIKLPAAMFTPHYGSKAVMGGNVLSNSRTADGSPFDPKRAYQPVGLDGNGGAIYQPIDVPLKYSPLGNELHAINPMTGEDYGAVSDIPIKSPTSTATMPAMSGNIDGQFVRVPGSRSSTPQTVNAPLIGHGASTASGPLAPPGASAAAPGTAPAIKAKGGKGSARAAAPLAASAASGNMTGLPPGASLMPRGFVPNGQATQQGKMYSAVMDPYVQLFGDPEVPGIPPISHYAALADNKEASNRIGTAVNLSMQALVEEGDKGGGLLTVFKNLGGLPTLESSAHAKAINDAIQQMTPLEREAYDRQMQMIGTLVGMRAITSASGGRWSVNNIKNEAPLFGINVADSKEFNRRLAGFAQQMLTASRKAPIFTEADRNKFKSEAQHLAQLGYGDNGSGKTFPKPPTTTTYKDYANAPNGHRIGSNDGQKTWFDVKTGQKVE